MDSEEIKANVKKELDSLLDDVMGVLLYGSWATGEGHERSDIDICIVAPFVKDKIAFYRRLISGIHDDRYDVKIFELIPLYLKMAIMDQGVVLYSKDVCELYEYFHSFRRMWEDQKRRQNLSRKEAMAMLGGSGE